MLKCLCVKFIVTFKVNWPELWGHPGLLQTVGHSQQEDAAAAAAAEGEILNQGFKVILRYDW